jgi:hypothetical protein
MPVQKLKAEMQGKGQEVWLKSPNCRLSQRQCY